MLALVALFAAIWPVAVPPAADLLALPGGIPIDLLFAFWLPVAFRLAPWAHLSLWVASFALLVALVRWWRPRHAINVSWVDEESCTGCTDCYQDCPYEAISMVPRSFGPPRSERVARVDPDRCVGCGLCAASCAPMGVGPFGRTGRDQLAAVRELALSIAPSGREVVVLACGNGPAARRERLSVEGAVVVTVTCAGSVHSAAIERLLRDGVGGVLLLSCPPRDCRFREGPKWLAARMFEGREAELKPRVDRRRVALVACAPHESDRARAAIFAMVARVRELGIVPDAGPEAEIECESVSREAVGA